jgi:hypothetical protein
MPTTNNNWPTPVATDLVKDGWEAIKDLGDAIDTTLGVYAPSTPGLTLINTTSFSGVSSQSVNDVFSATYDAYRVIVEYTGSTSLNLNFRFRVSGADETASNYQRQSIFNNAATTVIAAKTNNASLLTISAVFTSSDRSSVIMDFTSNPFAAIKKTWLTWNTDNINSGAGSTIANAGNGYNDTTSFTGFTLIASTGTITGTVSVYGYNK